MWRNRARQAAPAVVFLHGAGASGRMWREHVTRLHGAFHCLAPDLPGFGRSNHLPSASRDGDGGPCRGAHRDARAGASGAHRRAVVGRRRGPRPAGAPRRSRRPGGDRRRRTAPWWGERAVPGRRSPRSRPSCTRGPWSRCSADFIGMDEEGRADLRAASRRAFRRAFVEGFHVEPSPAELAAPCPTLLVAGEAETLVRPSNAAQASLMPHAVAVLRAGRAPRLAGAADGPARPDGGGLAHRTGAAGRARP